ncbi:MAG: OsmC family protein [Candidatus Sumerlaeota bacterium]|nr:OsmC family protein [Candidatus Sumerlaeota bacterium]
MPEPKPIVVEYSREGEEAHLLRLGSRAMSDIRIEYAGLPPEERAGSASQLLCASLTFCVAATFSTALAGRGAAIKSMKARGALEQDRDANQRMKVARIRVEVEVDVEEKDIETFEKCRRIMRHGCLIGYSLEQGVEVEQVFRRTGEE